MSPTMRRNLEEKGVILPKSARRNLKLSETVNMNNIKRRIQDVKLSHGGTSQEKKTEYNNVLQCVLDRNITKYHTSFGSGIASFLQVRRPTGKIDNTNEKKWKLKPRKTRKDRLTAGTVICQ